jgi:hypothetical protein
MKSKKSSHPPPIDTVALDDLEAWLACRLRWKFSQDQPPGAEPPPWAHLQKCILESVLYYHRLRAQIGKVHYVAIQEFFWDMFERQSLDASQRYDRPGDRARDMRAGEAVLEKYVARCPAEAPQLLGTGLFLKTQVPGTLVRLRVRADFLRPGLIPVLLKVTRESPDALLEAFRLAPWAAAITSAIQEQFGRAPQSLEAIYFVANESPEVVRLTIPFAPSETPAKLHHWLTAFSGSQVDEAVFPMPGSHCAFCPFREPCAKWPK